MSSTVGCVCGAQDEREGKVVPSCQRREPPQLSWGTLLTFLSLRSNWEGHPLPLCLHPTPKLGIRASHRAQHRWERGGGVEGR